MNITILGCGPSSGVPKANGSYKDCDINNEKNLRSRTSALININDYNILIDTSPDLRYQAINNNIRYINCVFYTHSHSDHFFGGHELNFLTPRAGKIEVFGDHETIGKFKQCFGYLNDKVIHHEFNYGDRLKYNTLTIDTIKQDHSYSNTVGYIFHHDNKKIAYCTDVFFIEESDLTKMYNVDIWIVGCLTMQNPSGKHAGFEKIMKWQKIVRAKKIILTHMNSSIDYNRESLFIENYRKSNMLDHSIYLSYDGLILNI